MKSFLLVLLLFCCGSVLPFELKSSWQARGEVQPQGKEGYVVTVVFFPTTTLDTLSNRRITELRAQFWAAEALSIHRGKTLGLKASVIEKKQERAKGEQVEVTYYVPLAAMLEGKKEEMTGPETDISFNPFESFRSPVYVQIQTFEKMAKMEKARGKSPAVMTAEQARQLKTMIDEDEDLLSREKRELLKRLEALQSAAGESSPL